MATFDISDDTKATAKGFAEKFGSKKKDKQNDKEKATSKAKDINGVNSTGNKLVPLKQGNEFLDMLMKVYGFIKKTHDADILRLEKQNNYKEEKDFEDAIRHKKLMDALLSLRTNLGATSTIVSSGGFQLPHIPNFPDRKPGKGGSNRASKGAGGKTSKGAAGSKTTVYRDPKTGRFTKAPTATKISKTLTGAKKLLSNLKGIPLLSSITAGIDMVMNIEQAIRDNEEGNIDDKELKKIIVKEIAAALAGIGGAEIGAAIGTVVGGPIGTVLGGIGGFAIGQYAGAELAGKLFDYYTGDKTNDMPEIKPKATLTTPVNKVKEIEKEPVSIPQASKSIPVSVTPTGDRFNRAQSENNTVKIDVPSQPSVSTINNVVANSGRNNKVMPSVSVPSVRNSESTFQDMIYYSTRVV